MKQEIKERWTTALRSGEYEQGVGYLRYEGKFCCLGVLCDLAVKDGVMREKKLPSGSYGYGDDKLVGSLPVEVRDWADLPDGDPEVPFKNLPFPLSMLNDEKELSFKLIADIIERQL
jgi:hypothetical protein